MPKERQKSTEAKGLIKSIEEKLEKSETPYINCEKMNLICPLEFSDIPYAKETWKYVLDLDSHSSIKIFNERHYEAIKSYCLAVATRQLVVDEWIKEGKPMTSAGSHGSLTVHPLFKDIDAKSRLVNKFAEDLGLTVLGELKYLKQKMSVKGTQGNSTFKDDIDDDINGSLFD